MAYVGLRKIIIAKRTGAKTYGEPFAFGKAIGMNVTPNYSEGSLNADDVQAEYDKEFNYAELSMNTSTVPLEAHDTMFGHTVNENAVDFNANDDPSTSSAGFSSLSMRTLPYPPPKTLLPSMPPSTCTSVLPSTVP